MTLTTKAKPLPVTTAGVEQGAGSNLAAPLYRLAAPGDKTLEPISKADFLDRNARWKRGVEQYARGEMSWDALAQLMDAETGYIGRTWPPGSVLAVVVPVEGGSSSAGRQAG